jgi:hypothetical protein
MKKTILSLGLVVAGAAAVNAQGLVEMYSVSPSFAVSTNGVTVGKLAQSSVTADGKYYFALLVDSTTPTSSNPTTGGWTLATSGGAAFLGTNYVAAGSLAGLGNNKGAAVDGWAAGTSEYVELVGWSASLGTSYAQVAAEALTGLWASTGYYGVSSFGSVASGGIGSPASPANSIFGGTGIPSGFDLNAVPEPTTIALAGLGGLSLLAFRRKKA